jgi:predicted HAD superfamily Cof-like phosphohydrolase
MHAKYPATPDQYNKVKEFMTLMGQQIPKDFVDSSTKTAELRHNLLSEEYKEWQKGSPLSEAVLDGLLDIMYVTYGAAVHMGLNYKEIRPTPLPLTQRKIAVDAYVAKALSAFRQRPLCRLTLEAAINELIPASIQAGMANGWDMAAAFDIVHESNLTKFWTKEEVKSMGISPDLTSYKPQIDKFVVFNSYGKVAKPPSFKPPNLQPILIAGLRLFETATLVAGSAASSVKIIEPAADPVAEPPPQPPAPVAVPQSRSKQAGLVVLRSKTS